jgi:putative transposase
VEHGLLFDELANGRRVKALTVVDDCSKEVVQIVADTSIPALYVTRVLDQVSAERGLPGSSAPTTARSSPAG